MIVVQAGSPKHRLRGWEIMLAGQGRGELVQSRAWLRVLKTEIPWLFWLTLLLRVACIHGC